MISVENIRYQITDLIQSQNKRFSETDIVTDAMIRKLLKKHKHSLSAIYTQLLNAYHLRKKVGEDDINKNKKTIRLSNTYALGQKLGRGAYAVVRSCKRRKDDKLFAVKIINKKGLNQWDLRGLRLEIDIMRDLEHDNIVRLYDVFESTERIGLIIGILQGGELLEVDIQKGSFSEYEASQCFAQLLDGLKYIHSKNIAHRDLKPDNLLFSEKISDFAHMKKNALVLVDFGLSERVKKGGLSEYC